MSDIGLLERYPCLESVFLDREAIAGRVAARIGEDPTQRILVQPAPGVSLQRLVDVLDLLREAGATNLTLLRL